jgi:hypothetical protein
MSRFVSPITDIKPNGSLRFYKSGTNTTLVTYKDDIETPGLENPVIVPVLANGNVQNVFYSGSARVIYLDEFDVQYAERDPVGGERELGDFTLWDVTVTYDLNDIVEGSNGAFYISLVSGNQGNDPLTEASKWNEIRFLGLWNTNILYSIGDVAQTTDGNLWKALTATAANDPSTDDGTNWLPAIDDTKIPSIIKLTWINKSADFTAVVGESYQIDSSGGAVSVTLPTYAVGESSTFHSESISTNTVLLLNPAYTINGPSGSFSAGTDIELVAGNSVQMVAKSTSILEIVGVQT